MQKGLAILLFFSLGLAACGPNRADYETARRQLELLTQENLNLQNELELLKQKNEDLKADLEVLHFEPQRLLQQTQAALRDRKFAEVKTTVELLLQKFPASCEASQAERLLEEANKMILAETAAAEAKSLQTKAEDQKRIAAATAKMRVSVDTAKGITWYEDKNTPQNDNVFKIFLTIALDKNNTPRLHFGAHHVAKNWLDIESFTIIADNKKFDSGLMKFYRGGVGLGFVWEYIDMPVGPQELEWIRALIASKKAIIQYHGEQSDADREISALQKNALQNVLDAFRALGGTLPK
jgi:hypothetical protein